MKKQKHEKLLKIVTALIIVIIVSSLAIIHIANRPVRKAKSEAKKIAADIAGIDRVTDFYWFTREKTYFTILGSDTKGTNLTVFIPDDGSEAVVMDQAKGTTEDDIIQSVLEFDGVKRIKKISLGMQKKQPVWEVVTTSQDGGLNYYLLDYTNGKVVQEIKNV
ncbi:hypothetical protein CBF34_03010 [Vagococcus penaei]|uniref:Cell wall elongation regulator TseB-like domain-containing protein n=1 Tax=Vagococcus penaei TaxID=633807 RepID=A0A1Q2D414_9ENTE|nr:DUF5590 domain-containing protein [Vagococcus penaei]AQP53041.1 hypothetical protein BW732_01575 [Vagococcus penaei]RSU06096.1 hypothetical protein CBF34_03010 [Vagococcus penaei]